MDCFYAASPLAHPIFDGAERAKEDLDALLVVPADTGIERLDELLNGGALAVPSIEQFVLQPTEEALASCVVGRACLARHRTGEVRVSHSR